MESDQGSGRFRDWLGRARAAREQRCLFPPLPQDEEEHSSPLKKCASKRADARHARLTPGIRLGLMVNEGTLPAQVEAAFSHLIASGILQRIEV